MSGRLFVSPGRSSKLVALETKVTKRPLPRMAGWVLPRSRGVPSFASDTIVIPGVQPVAPRQVSKRNTSCTPLVSFPVPIRFEAADAKAMKRPLALRAGARLLLSPPPVGELVTPGAVSVTVAKAFLVEPLSLALSLRRQPVSTIWQRVLAGSAAGAV